MTSWVNGASGCTVAARDRRLTPAMPPAVPFAAMSPTPLLLRVLLSLALVLNGIGSAIAAVHLPAGHDLAPATALPDAAPCHDPAPVTPADGGDDGTCCDGARCDCACTVAGTTVATGVVLPFPTRPVALATHRLDAGHRAPALAHPIRPPIG
jgi:hypothetical protein